MQLLVSSLVSSNKEIIFIFAAVWKQKIFCKPNIVLFKSKHAATEEKEEIFFKIPENNEFIECDGKTKLRRVLDTNNSAENFTHIKTPKLFNKAEYHLPHTETLWDRRTTELHPTVSF